MILALPLLNFFILCVGGRLMGKVGTVYFVVFSGVFLCWLSIKMFFMLLCLGVSVEFSFGTWVAIAIFSVDFEILFDIPSVTMLAMVSMISLFVQLYSISYMAVDPHFIRFMSYLSLFTFFMFILVTAANFLQLFLGWEGVGLCSYLLINFWFTRVQANKAALKALFMNRVGDIAYLLGLTLLFLGFNSVTFSVLTVLMDLTLSGQGNLGLKFVQWEFELDDAIAACFFIGVVGKSAQLTLHTWIPAAMEGPTPVSALIHAATMVTAGVFLLIRGSFIFISSPKMQLVIVVVGAITAILSAVTAIFVFDLKRIVAYSTCSQLGYMVIACGIAHYNVAFFHLVNHAFFKALLFLSAGAVIHTCANEQDIRKLINIFPLMPLVYVAFLTGNVAIMGFPFLSGFYSKELIIEFCFLSAESTWLVWPSASYLLFMFVLLATMCTAIYSFRFMYFLFFRGRGLRVFELSNKPQSQPFFIRWVLVALIGGSMWAGYFLSDLFMTGNLFFFNDSFQDELRNFENEFLPWYIKLFPLILNIVVLCLGICFIVGYQYGVFNYYFRSLLAANLMCLRGQQGVGHFGLNSFYFYWVSTYSAFWKLLSGVGSANFYFNEVYNYLSFVVWSASYTHIFLNIDKGILELIGPTGIAHFYFFMSRVMAYLYTISLRRQLFIFFSVGLVFLCYTSLFL